MNSLEWNGRLERWSVVLDWTIGGAWPHIDTEYQDTRAQGRSDLNHCVTLSSAALIIIVPNYKFTIYAPAWDPECQVSMQSSQVVSEEINFAPGSA